MRYAIKQLWFGFAYEISITKDEFDALKEARGKSLLFSSFEDKFMLLLENYEELEQEIMRMSLNQMIYYSGRNTPLFIDNLRLLNRRLANLMTTCRLYKDQTAHDISTIYGKESKQFENYKQFHADHYDQKLSYRTMEAARNFLQHRSFIISSISEQSERMEKEDRVSHTVKVNLNLMRLRDEGEFKSKILSELNAIADKKGHVDIRPLVREYVASLGEIHIKLRKMIDNDASKFDLLIMNAIKQLNDLSGENHESVYVVAINDNNKLSDNFVILKDFVERRQRIINKTQRVTHYATNYVSSK